MHKSTNISISNTKHLYLKIKDDVIKMEIAIYDILQSHGKWSPDLLIVVWFILKVHSEVWENVLQLKALENWWKCFLFHLKSSFRPQDI